MTWQAPLPPLEPGESVGQTAAIWQGIQAEVIARVVALFTSIFAAVDALIHCTTGLYKWVSYSKSAAYDHFRQAAWFAGLALVGSIAGVVWPGVFARCRYSPPPPSEEDSFSDIPPCILDPAEEVHQDKQQPPFESLKQLWERSSLEERSWFVRLFGLYQTKFKAVREELASTVYRPLQDRPVRWLSATEIVTQRIGIVWERVSRTFFYHATSEPALESILKSGRVEVRHEKVFRGAFVSTKPEISFGSCILAFTRDIERLSSLEHGFQVGSGTYWAGFSRSIPVTDSTLSCILLAQGTEAECDDLAARCQQWTGRSIAVIPLRNVKRDLAAIEQLDMGIPREWPSDDAKTGQGILRTLQARAPTMVLQPSALLLA